MDKDEVVSLSPEGVSRRHSVHVSTVRRALRNKEIAFSRKGTRILIRVEDADRWASSGPELPFFKAR